MNYRHAYHAGNFADVLKHAVLARIIDYLKRKERPFRVMDTHAGRGLYDLSSIEAQKTGEWQAGIGRIAGIHLPPPAAALLEDYLGVVARLNPDGALHAYPGSPLLARRLLRRQDRLSAVEMHPEDAVALKALFAGDYQARVLELDGWLALGAHLPPKERRGLVLVDPPFEEEDEFTRMGAALVRAHRRWPDGIYALWYPIKSEQKVRQFRVFLEECGIRGILDLVLLIDPEAGGERLRGCGMVVVNPPYVLEKEMEILLPALASVLGSKRSASWSIDWLAPETVAT